MRHDCFCCTPFAYFPYPKTYQRIPNRTKKVQKYKFLRFVFQETQNCGIPRSVSTPLWSIERVHNFKLELCGVTFHTFVVRAFRKTKFSRSMTTKWLQFTNIWHNCEHLCIRSNNSQQVNLHSISSSHNYHGMCPCVSIMWRRAQILQNDFDLIERFLHDHNQRMPCTYVLGFTSECNLLRILAWGGPKHEDSEL